VLSKNEFKSASRYTKNQSAQKLDIPKLTGIFFIFISLDYLASAFFALGQGKSFYFLISIAIFGMIVSSFVLLRHGKSQEVIYNNSKYATSPKYPLKTFGAIILACATTISAYFGSYGLISSVMLGGSVLLGWYMYYGFDPMVDKIDGYESDKSAQRIMKLLIQANKDISSIKEYAKSINSATIAPLMMEMAEEFERIVKHIESEPNDYDKARKYLVSYLGELKSMSESFAKLDSNEKIQEVQNSFKETLQSSIEKLKKQYEKLIDDDILDLDIKLSVMKKRFKNEE